MPIDPPPASRPSASRTAAIRETARKDVTRAETMLTDFISTIFDIPVSGLQINLDQYSLNSLNGFFASDGQEFFFKFHQEEGEEEMTGEYYRADILSRAGLPVDQPVFLSTLPGEQLLVYRRRSDPRFSDILFALDQSDDETAIDLAVQAEKSLNDSILRVAKATLTPVTPDQAAAEPIHRLFHERLIDPRDGRYPGGRLASFYIGKKFRFPGQVELGWDQISRARPVINGVAYRRSLSEMFDLAYERYAPRNMGDAGGIVAHGDAHNANIWYENGDNGPSLAFFDPAFAGDKVPSLLAEVKSTFHNIFAHPFWLYNPEMAQQRYQASVQYRDDMLCIDTDWQPSRVRLRLLDAKAMYFWKPWLRTLSDKGMLPDDWQDVIRIGLFLSPTLVMSLVAGPDGDRHNPLSSAIGLSVALAAGSNPISGSDLFTSFFQKITP
ncbi:hypothetical protein Q0601_18995 [Paracoccus onubensis]|uniref:hypothetical protein n=1 Tax=Paracoccus onubensis TaxID=1675788 RepID=UPI002731F05D|nr:hypothetical protein [Paracoccus onubensis]MDP0929276.1 hypothetical protein [Paracoccus onubensis]